MQDVVDQIVGYLKGIWNKRWYAMLIAWLFCFFGWGIIFVLPDQYESRAKIFIDTQSLLKPLLKGLTIQTNVDQQINLMVRTLLARPNVEKIIRLSDLDLDVNTDDEFDELVKHLQKKINFASHGRKNKNIYDLSYQNTSPEVAQIVLQSVITVFIENSIGESKEDTISARKFLTNQIKEYERRLSESENRLKDFKQKNMGMLPSSGGMDYYARMEQAKNNLEESKLSLREAEKRQAATDKELANIIQVLKSSGREVQIITPYDERISDLHRELDKMLLNYTDQHPDVLALRRVLKNLLKKQQDALVELKSEEHSAKNNLELNPVYQELKINLGTATADVESLKVRVAEHKQRYEKLQRLVNTIPEIEAQLTALNRDYKITKSKYEEFLDRRESASISESVDQTTESIQFKVIESPRVENIPVGPKRILLSSAVLLISLSLGVGFAFLLSQLKPVVMSSKQMMEVTNLPVLGTVSAVVSPAQRRRRFLLIFSYLSLLIALFVIFGLLMGWYIIAN